MPNKSVSLHKLAAYCKRLLLETKIEDYPGACNGLQVENSGSVWKIAAAVDGTLTTVRMAAEGGATLLLVHHGLFWSPSHPWVGKRYELMQLLLKYDLAVYSSHLPLDAHPTLGNNAVLFSALGLKQRSPFLLHRGQKIGFLGRGPLELKELSDRLEKATGVKPHVIPAGPKVCRRIGVVSGGGGGDLAVAAQEGADTFITGEGPHWTYGLAEELGVNVLYGGHYATETFGVKALAQHLSHKYGVPWFFVDHPTGL